MAWSEGMIRSAFHVLRELHDVFKIPRPPVEVINSQEDVELLVDYAKVLLHGERLAHDDVVVYLASSILAMTGDIDAFDGMLRNIPYGAPSDYPRPMYTIKYLRKVIPFPGHLTAYADPQEVLDWIKENKGRLLWSSDSRTYCLNAE